MNNILKCLILLIWYIGTLTEVYSRLLFKLLLLSALLLIYIICLYSAVHMNGLILIKFKLDALLLLMFGQVLHYYDIKSGV